MAIVGCGPAGVYTADTLIKSTQTMAVLPRGVQVDLFDRLPTPFGLIRYGVAPDHPRIKGVALGLHRVMSQQQIRFWGNVEYPSDISLADLIGLYDAVVFSTGASRDADLDLPGIDLEGSFGAADFVSWFNGHPDVCSTWPLTARRVAVLGVGNVALDVARILAKDVGELEATEIPPNVERGLAGNAAREIHVFGRRGPAQCKFTPMELRELGESPSIDVRVDDADLQYDAASLAARASSKQLEQVVEILHGYAAAEPHSGARRSRVHLHLLEAPERLLGQDGVSGLVTQRQQLVGDGSTTGTGARTTWGVDAVYRAVGYRPSAVPGLGYDHEAGTVRHHRGRAQDARGAVLAGVYVCGWAKRGPVGLIGHTRADAKETVASLVADIEEGRLAPVASEQGSIDRLLLDRGVRPTDWQGWLRLDEHERALGASRGRDRTKVVARERLTALAGVSTGVRLRAGD